MSFSSDVKIELCKIEEKKDCCRHALTYGLLLFSKSFSPHKITIRNTSKEVVDLYANYIALTTNSIVDITTHKNTSSLHRYNYTINIPSESERIKIFTSFGYDKNDIGLRINMSNIDDEHCYKAFLRGTFLSCGYINNPQKGYRLEFRVQYIKLANDLKKVIQDIQNTRIEPLIIKKQGIYCLYIRNSEQITDLLAYIGASSSTMKYIQTKMIKEIRGYVNRTTNFETANINKTATASVYQINAINKIKDTIGLDSLNDDFKLIAKLRLDNPELSLNQLIKKYNLSLSKSTLNRRFNKIIEMANKIKK